MDTTGNSFWDKILPNAEYNRFSIICIILLVIGCLGGVTVGIGAINSIVQTFLVVLPTMMCLSLLLAGAKMSQLLTTASIAVVIDILLIIINLF